MMNLRGMGFALLSGFLFVGFFVLLVWMLGGCTPAPEPLPAPPVGNYPAGSDIVIAYPDNSPEAITSPCGQACANLAKIGCPEGGKTDAGASCYRACVLMVQLEQIPVACWTTAPSPDAVRACGPQLRCTP